MGFHMLLHMLFLRKTFAAFGTSMSSLPFVNCPQVSDQRELGAKGFSTTKMVAHVFASFIKRDLTISGGIILTEIDWLTSEHVEELVALNFNLSSCSYLTPVNSSWNIGSHIYIV